MASTAGTQGPQAPPRPPAVGKPSPPERDPGPRILYFEEGGTLLSPRERPVTGARRPMPPLPAAAKPKGAPPVAGAAKAQPRGKEPARAGTAPARARVDGSPAAPAATPAASPGWGEQVDRAMAASDYAALAGLADASGAAFDCDRPERAWAVAEALASADRLSRAAAVLDPLATRCDAATRLATLERARLAISRDQYRQWEAREARAVRDPDSDRRFRRMVLDRIMEDRAAAAGGAPGSARERAEAFAREAGDAIIEFREAGAAVGLGWMWLEAGDRAQADLWFGRALAWAPQSEDALVGLANSARVAGDHAGAMAWASRLPADAPARAAIRRDARVEIARRDYDAGRFAEAAAGLEAAAAEGPLPRHARAMLAWCRYRQGDRDGAAALFAALYRESPDRESAEGLVAAAGGDASRDYADLAATPPLAAFVATRRAEEAFRNGRYLEAREIDPARWGAAGSPGTTHALAGAGTREKTGEPGLGRLRQSPWAALDAGTSLGDRTAIALRAERATLDAGTLEPGAIVGSAPTGAGPTPANATRETVDEASVVIRHESAVALSLLVGRGPGGGPVGSRPTGAIEVAATPAWGQAGAALYAEPVRETVLSYAGMRDPWTGAAWGGVQRRGGELRLLRLREAPWTAGIRLRYERLDGTLVQDNSRAVADVTLGRDLGLAGFAYAAASAYAGYESYRRNLSGFTLGHGGYFSPQRYARVGAALDFMTQEDRPWLVRGRVSGGWFSKRDDASPLLPLDPDGRTWGGGSATGHEAGIRLAGVVQAGAHVQLGVVVGRSISPAYAENIARAELRVLLEPRRSVVAADLPTGRGY